MIDFEFISMEMTCHVNIFILNIFKISVVGEKRKVLNRNEYWNDYLGDKSWLKSWQVEGP